MNPNEEKVYCDLDEDGKRLHHMLVSVSNEECQKRTRIAKERRAKNKAEKQTPEYKRRHFGETIAKDLVINDYRNLFPDSTESKTKILQKIKKAGGFYKIYDSVTPEQRDAYFQRATKQ